MYIEVKQLEPKLWGLFIDGRVLGTSKNRFDADHGRAIIENAQDRENAINRVALNLDMIPEHDPTVLHSVNNLHNPTDPNPTW